MPGIAAEATTASVPVTFPTGVMRVAPAHAKTSFSLAPVVLLRLSGMGSSEEIPSVKVS